MTIREATIEDIPAIADLAEVARVRQESWDPQFWATAVDARAIHPLFLRRNLEMHATAALLAEDPRGVLGATIATEIAGIGTTAGGPVWLLGDFHVADASSWDTAGRALLTATAARARSLGAGELLVPCPHADLSMAGLLQSAGLSLRSWFRHRVLTGAPPAPPVGVRGLVPADGPEVAGLVTGSPRHRHAWDSPRRFDRDGDILADGIVLDDGDGILGVGLVSAPVPSPPVYRRGGTTVVIDPLALDPSSDWEADGGRLLAGAQFLAARRGDVAVVVPCGPGELLKEQLLDVHGYGRPLDWWSLRWG